MLDQPVSTVGPELTLETGYISVCEVVAKILHDSDRTWSFNRWQWKWWFWANHYQHEEAKDVSTKHDMIFRAE